jgi:hypothetical protein
MRKNPHPGFYLPIDTAVATLVIACVIMALTMSITRARKLVETSVAAAEIMITYRTPVSVQFALRGEWPKNLDDVRQEFPVNGNWPMSSRLKDLRLEDGALTVTLRRPLAGERLTLHPAVPSDDPRGPVRWVAGPSGRRSGWTVVGDDHTTVKDPFIPVLLKR